MFRKSGLDGAVNFKGTYVIGIECGLVFDTIIVPCVGELDAEQKHLKSL